MDVLPLSLQAAQAGTTGDEVKNQSIEELRKTNPLPYSCDRHQGNTAIRGSNVHGRVIEVITPMNKHPVATQFYTVLDFS